jgi:hypothetical protein
VVYRCFPRKSAQAVRTGGLLIADQAQAGRRGAWHVGLAPALPAAFDQPGVRARYFRLQLAGSHLTQRLFGKIFGRIARLAWHPT